MRPPSRRRWLPHDAQAQAIELDIKTPKDFRSYAERLKAAYDQVNRTALGDEGWRAQYSAFVKFYEEVKEAHWWSLGDSTYEELREWERRLADWQDRLRGKGLDVGPQVKPPERSPSGSEAARGLLDGATGLVKWGAVGLALYLAAQVVKR